MISGGNAANENVILIDLDTIIDTRLGTLAKLDPAAASDIFSSPMFRTRLSDEFSLIDSRINHQAYLKAYLERDVETLGLGMPTALLGEFSMILESLLDEIIGPNPEDKVVRVEINTYPYVLSAEECDDICACFREWTGTVFDIKTVHIPVSDMSMSLLVMRKIACIFTYDFDRFQYFAFVKNVTKNDKGIPQVSLMVPRLAVSLDTLKQSSEEILPNGDKLDPFEFLRLHYGPLIGIQFIEPERFTAFNPI